MDVEIAAAVALCALSYYNYLHIQHKRKIKKTWKRRRWWMTQIHRNRTRLTMDNQLSELFSEPSGEFNKFTRMSYVDFEYLLQKITQSISKKETHLREAIPARIRLAVTLRFLASGDSYDSLHFLFKISPQLISQIIPEVCVALTEVLKNEIKIPACAEEWLEIEKGFVNKFPRCIGALDGKHIVMQCPANTSSMYFNYKKTFSVVLLALVDSNYNFIFVDIGCQGRISDGGVFRNSKLWKKINSNALNLPPPHPLPGSNKDVPYVFLADAAFALSTHVMKPFPGNHDRRTPKRIYNQKLSSARVVVENAFGILAAKFRVFQKPLALCPEKVTLVTMTCVLLHNFLRKSGNSTLVYTPPGTMDVYNDEGLLVKPGSWREEIANNCAIRNFLQIPRRPRLIATTIREEFKKYFNDYIAPTVQ